MPNTKSAAKAMRQSIRRKKNNTVKKDAFKAAVKQVKKAVAAGDKQAAEKALPAAMKALGKASKTRVIHKNTTARKVSRLAKAINKLK